jgi:hypothetical protein
MRSSLEEKEAPTLSGKEKAQGLKRGSERSVAACAARGKAEVSLKLFLKVR